MSSEPRDRDNWSTEGCVTESAPFGDATASLLRMQDIIGRKWQPLLVYHLRQSGTLGFSDLKSAVDGISSKMLSESLDDLEEAGIVTREIVSERPVRVAYSLTDAGESLEGIVCDLIRWEEEYLDDADDEDTRNERPLLADGGEADGTTWTPMEER